MSHRVTWSRWLNPAHLGASRHGGVRKRTKRAGTHGGSGPRAQNRASPEGSRVSQGPQSPASAPVQAQAELGSTPRSKVVRMAASLGAMVTDPWQTKLDKPAKAEIPPRYPTSSDLLFRRYEQQGFTRDQIWTAAHQVCLEDARFCDNGSPYLRPVRDYRVSTDRNRDLNRIPEAQRDRLKKHLADDMVGLTHRAPVRFTTLRQGRPDVEFKQSHAHTRARVSAEQRVTWSLAEGYTLSSEVAKKDDRPVNGHSLQHCANSGYIGVDHTMLAWRSARCDTPQKLEENLVGSCCASLTCAGGDKTRARGWRQGEGGVWEYQPVLVTAMDKSLVKHLWELIRSFFGGEKRTERARLQALNASCKSVFPERDRAGRLYTIEVNGQQERVYILPPQVVNVVLSSQAKRASALRDARMDNHDAAYKMGELLIEALRKKGEDNDADTIRVFLETPTEQRQMRLQEVAYRDRVTGMRPPLRLATEWLHVVLAKSTLDGDEMTRRTDPAIEALLLKHMFDEANLAASVGCKSGVDRTPVLCALMSSAHAYEAENDTVYDPLHATPEQTAAMHLSFTQFADAWAVPVVEMTRGMKKPYIKWDSQPVANEWYVTSAGKLRWKPESKAPGAQLDPELP